MSRGETATHERRRALAARRHARRDGPRRRPSATRVGAALPARRRDRRVDLSPSSAARARDSPPGWSRWASSPATASRSSASTRPEWTLADCGALCAGATVVPDLPHELAGGVRVRARALGRARGHLRGRRAGRQGRGGPRRAARTLEHVVVDRRRSPARCRSPSCARARRRRRRVAVDGVAARSRPTTSRRSSTRPAPPARRRAACSRTRTCWPRCDMYERQLDLARRAVVIFLFLPLAHVARARDADRRARRRRHARLLERRRRAPRSRTSPRRAPDARPVGPARVREDPHARAGRGRGRRRAASARCSTGRSRPAARVARGASARARRPAAARAARALADRLVLVEGARPVRRPRSSSRSPAPRRSRSEVLEFFDACGVLVLEGYGMTETCAAATLNTPAAFRVRHRRPRRCRAPRCDRRRTARS